MATYTIVRAVLSAASSGDNTLVAAVTGKKIRVLGVVLAAASAVTVQFESGTGGTFLTGAIPLVANGDLKFVLPVTLPGYHWFETAAGVLLNVILGGAVQVSGCLIYYVE